MSDAKIIVIPEGRDGIWLVTDRASLKEFIRQRCGEMIHNYLPCGPALLGADWEVESVLDHIDRADKVAVLQGEAARNNFVHALSLIMPADGDRRARLEIFDIGDITETDVEVSEQPAL